MIGRAIMLGSFHPHLLFRNSPITKYFTHFAQAKVIALVPVLPLPLILLTQPEIVTLLLHFQRLKIDIIHAYHTEANQPQRHLKQTPELYP